MGAVTVSHCHNLVKIAVKILLLIQPEVSVYIVLYLYV